MNRSNITDARLWRPAVRAGDAPYYRRLADALHGAIRAGTLEAGTRLPTQRALAAALGVSVGTASAAYVEAERRGLVRRHVGRGTFVASPGTRAFTPAGQLNLAVNIPPFHAAAPTIRRLLAQLIEDADSTELLGYPLFRSDGRYATATAGWISRATGVGAVAAKEVVPSQGATQGLLATMDYLFERGDRVICERVTYGGFKVVARVLGVQLVPVDQDEEGMVPDAVERAVRDQGARGIVICATHQNPTGSTASLGRREALLALARRYDLWIVEDDVYGALATPGHPPPLAALDRARTFHVSSASKSLAPGLRAGWVLPPAAHRDRIAVALNARMESLAPFGCPVLTAGAAPFGFLAFAKMCETRMADEVAGIVRSETRRRAELAQRVLGPHMQRPADGLSLHVWLPMNPSAAESLHQRLALQDIRATPPGAPMVGAPPSGLRLCLGGPERVESLEEALHVVRGELDRLAERHGSWVP